VDKLNIMGPERVTTEDQRIFLLEISEKFRDICNAAVDGAYDSASFFHDPESSAVTLKKRLRAVVQRLNRKFAEKMRTKGHWKELAEGFFGTTFRLASERTEDDPQRISRHDAIEWVKPMMQRACGRELPGTYNPLLIGELFAMQSKKWDKMAEDHLHAIFQV
jgi:hypothetical protein